MMSLDDLGSAHRFAVVDNEVRKISMRLIRLDSESFKCDQQ
jgi:hypothetical protein